MNLNLNTIQIFKEERMSQNLPETVSFVHRLEIHTSHLRQLPIWAVTGGL